MDTRLVGRVLDIARSVNPLLAVSAAALDLKQPPPDGAVRARVAARLADGTFRVLIDGKALKLALPDDVKTGDILQLRVVGRGGDASDHAAGAGAAGGKGVSAAGQWVADLAKQPVSAPPRQTQPIVLEPPDAPELLAEPLARAVERSGLFYESHQARWVNGEFPLSRLLEEPQARTGQPQSNAAPEAPDDAPPEASAASVPRPLPVAEDIDVRARPSPDAARGTPEGEPRPADKGGELVARETVAVVRQQLDTLETRQFTWIGEIWPGQPMRWQIGEESDAEARPADAGHAWDSRFTLDLPALGSVGAELTLAGNRLRVRLSAQDEATVALMRDHGRELLAALSAAGIDATSFEVQHRESDL